MLSIFCICSLLKKLNQSEIKAFIKFQFVSMASAIEADAVINDLNGAIIVNKTVKVKKARPSRDVSDQLRGRTEGGDGGKGKGQVSNLTET